MYNKESLHSLALQGKLDTLPKNMLTLENMLKMENGRTPLHIAAQMGHLFQLPTELITLETMLTRTAQGNTVFHEAAYDGKLHDIPLDLLTVEVCAIKNLQGETVAHYAAASNSFCQIPKKLLTAELVLCENKDNWTPLQSLMHLKSTLDPLLGIDFGESEKAKALVGEEWWAKNLEVLSQKKDLELHEEAPGIDIF